MQKVQGDLRGGLYMSEKWIDDEEAAVAFRVLMESVKEPLDSWLYSIREHFDETPNSILIRVLGYGVAFFNQALEEGSTSKEAYHIMLQKLSAHPLAQQMFVMAGGSMMNRAAGVEE
jgi:hypothetical protein